MTADADEFKASVEARIASSPELSRHIAHLSDFVPASDRVRFRRLLRLSLQYAYTDGMKAGAEYMVPTK